MDINITDKKLIITAYNLIRREIRRFDRESNDAELANYIRGIVDLQTELYNIIANTITEASKTEKEIETPFD